MPSWGHILIKPPLFYPFGGQSTIIFSYSGLFLLLLTCLVPTICNVSKWWSSRAGNHPFLSGHLKQLQACLLIISWWLPYLSPLLVIFAQLPRGGQKSGLWREQVLFFLKKGTGLLKIPLFLFLCCTNISLHWELKLGSSSYVVLVLFQMSITSFFKQSFM